MPVVIERSPGERDLVCGGFLGWDALAELQRLGLDPAALGARPIHRLRLVGRRTDRRGRHCRAGGGPVAPAARRDPAAHGGGSGRRGAARPHGARARRRMPSGSTTARRWRPRSLFLATGKHELRGAARRDRRAAGLGRPARRAAADAALPRRWPGRSSCTSMTAAMPACSSRRTGPPISACPSRATGWPDRDELIAALIDGIALARQSGSRGAAARHWEAIAGRALWLAGANDRAGPLPGRRPGGGDRQPRRRRHRHRAGQRRGGGPCLPRRRGAAGLPAQLRPPRARGRLGDGRDAAQARRAARPSAG